MKRKEEEIRVFLIVTEVQILNINCELIKMRRAKNTNNI